jgi:ribosomal protein L37AE/L43A
MTQSNKESKPQKVVNPCPYHPKVELVRRGRADWYCKKCKKNMMLELVLIAETTKESDD